LILVPTTAEGFSVTPIEALGQVETSATYYDDVRVPVSNVVGEIDAGWRMITTQLNHERVGLAAYSGICDGMLADVTAWAAWKTTPAGQPYAYLPWVADALAQPSALSSAMNLMNWNLVEATASEAVDPGQASAAKIYATEAAIEIYRTMLEILG